MSFFSSLVSVSNTGTGFALLGSSTDGSGVDGTSTNNVGVMGTTDGLHRLAPFRAGVVGLSTNNTGVDGQSDNGIGVRGVSLTLEGVVGSGAAIGVHGLSTSGDGVNGLSTRGSGVNGRSTDGAGVNGSSTNGFGVVGTSGPAFGVMGTSTSGTGVRGTGNTGIWGSGGRLGVKGDGSVVGISGESTDGWGVAGTTTTGLGVDGNSMTGTGTRGVSDSGDGVNGMSGSGYGVHGVSNSNLAGAFEGRVQIFTNGSNPGNLDVAGTLSKGGGSFKIDHPLDPENKYLYHSFVESPDMMNIYNGNVITDENGNASVKMPDYFEALNFEFRYQLTVIGQFAQAIVSRKIKNNEFGIKTSAPGVEVSWQLTGVRRDAWANKNRIKVEVEKDERERGFYLHPEVFNQPEERGIKWAQHPEMMTQMKQRRQEFEKTHASHQAKKVNQ